jgi:hypothetical protein
MKPWSHWGCVRVADDLPEFFWSDGDSSEGVPHAPKDKANTPNSKTNKRRMNTSLIFCERTELGPPDPLYTGQFKTAARHLATATNRDRSDNSRIGVSPSPSLSWSLRPGHPVYTIRQVQTEMCIPARDTIVFRSSFFCLS